LSAAAFLKEVGKKTPVTVRLSTVVHERGWALAFTLAVSTASNLTHCSMLLVLLFSIIKTHAAMLPMCVLIEHEVWLHFFQEYLQDIDFLVWHSTRLIYSETAIL
jgi:hypothetical protein